ncbi:LOW QUALITY PROTEIN: adenine-specific methyltransferase [Geomicrobium sp. JCM 19039]|nr:LOW QUALITY PROTEIN: adenine-specific methyltransferase [Geomicrobium sp. JCM 19039]
MKRQLDVDQLFHTLDTMTEILTEEGHGQYLEALAQTGENLFRGEILQEPLSDGAMDNMDALFKQVHDTSIEKETVRKAFQLAIIKGMKQSVQPHHAMTPDGIAVFSSYLIQRLIGADQKVTVYDPAVGTGNLLTAVMNHTDNIEKRHWAEVDESLINLAYVMSNLQQYDLELLQMDSVREQGIPDVDLILSDLPIGIYTNDDVVESFESKPDDARMPAEYALIENSLKSLKLGGIGLYLIPNDMFSRDHSENFRAFMKREAITLGMLQLPVSMFKAEKHQKSIWMIQKKGPGVTAPSQALLAELPSFQRADALSDMMTRINDWFLKHFSR